MTNARIAKEIEDRGRIDDHRFRKAGIGPIQKTYPYDPTKQHRSSSEKSAVGVKSANRN